MITKLFREFNQQEFWIVLLLGDIKAIANLRCEATLPAKKPKKQYKKTVKFSQWGGLLFDQDLHAT
jgi:hypothetical protein